MGNLPLFSELRRLIQRHTPLNKWEAYLAQWSSSTSMSVVTGALVERVAYINEALGQEVLTADMTTAAVVPVVIEYGALEEVVCVLSDSPVQVKFSSIQRFETMLEDERVKEREISYFIIRCPLALLKERSFVSMPFVEIYPSEISRILLLLADTIVWGLDIVRGIKQAESAWLARCLTTHSVYVAVEKEEDIAVALRQTKLARDIHRVRSQFKLLEASNEDRHFIRRQRWIHFIELIMKSFATMWNDEIPGVYRDKILILSTFLYTGDELEELKQKIQMFEQLWKDNFLFPQTEKVDFSVVVQRADRVFFPFIVSDVSLQEKWQQIVANVDEQDNVFQRVNDAHEKLAKAQQQLEDSYTQVLYKKTLKNLSHYEMNYYLADKALDGMNAIYHSFNDGFTELKRAIRLFVEQDITTYYESERQKLIQEYEQVKERYAYYQQIVIQYAHEVWVT